jgi:hypothetical protein
MRFVLYPHPRRVHYLSVRPEGQPMISMPETRYAKSGDTYIAYQVMGDGPLDLVFVPGFISHLDMQLELPATESFRSRRRPHRRV